MAKELKNLLWITDLLPDAFEQKKMFGGFAFYVDGKLVLILIETTGSKVHNGFEYPFEIWNGCLFPVEKIKQSAVFLKFPFLTSHPATTKWLYLPEASEDFEDKVEVILREIKKRNSLFGTVTASSKRVKASDEIDTRKPSSFKESSSVSKSVTSPLMKNKKSAKKVKANKKPSNSFLLDILKRKSK